MFKAGDKIIRIKSEYAGMKTGDIGTVIRVINDRNVLLEENEYNNFKKGDTFTVVSLDNFNVRDENNKLHFHLNIKVLDLRDIVREIVEKESK